MSCKHYAVGIAGDRWADVHFSEDDEHFGCACTFPHNDSKALSMERLATLALLGAAVHLTTREGIGEESGVAEPARHVDPARHVPEWIRAEILRLTGQPDADTIRLREQDARVAALRERMTREISPGLSKGMPTDNGDCAWCGARTYDIDEQRPAEECADNCPAPLLAELVGLDGCGRSNDPA